MNDQKLTLKTFSRHSETSGQRGKLNMGSTFSLPQTGDEKLSTNTDYTVINTATFLFQNFWEWSAKQESEWVYKD